MHRTTTERLKNIQTHLQLEPDGLLGPQTLTAIEQALQIVSKPHAREEKPDPAAVTKSLHLTLDTEELQAIINDEIGSPEYYKKRLRSPCWPGGDSGITIGVGYDLGYVDKDRFLDDWSSQLSAPHLQKLSKYCAVKGAQAKSKLRFLADIKIPLTKASIVFRSTSVPAYAARTRRAFPGIENLTPIAQTTLLSLVYNRGASMKGDSRKEMRAIRMLVKTRDYQGMADQVRSMKRLWEGRGLDGLLIRREREALALERAHKGKKSKKTVIV
ncbi:MAG: hypothetical protein CL693_21410 [Cellvibrionaceae bacterium]|nr:hypothetical protein [Cellvibrionaceae bacterium]